MQRFVYCLGTKAPYKCTLFTFDNNRKLSCVHHLFDCCLEHLNEDASLQYTTLTVVKICLIIPNVLLQFDVMILK